jgi:hypothetical protein
MSTSKKKQGVNAFTIIGFILAFMVLIFYSPFEKKVPEGLPTDYYDHIENLENNKVKIYIYSDVINLNNHYEYTKLTTLSSSTVLSTNPDSFIVIDMNKYKNEYEDSRFLDSLTTYSCSYFIFVNLSSSDINYSFESIDETEMDSDIIFYKNNEKCNTDFSSLSFTGGFPNDIFLNYIIIDTISKILDGIIQ